MKKIDILSACRSPKLFSRWFKNQESWRAWRTFLKTLFGLPMDAADVELYRKCTGRNDLPAPGGFQEAFLICGRRAGKSMMLALIATYLATFQDWTPYLSPGERATLVVIAADRKQARVIFRYLAAYLKNVDSLATLIERETADTIELSNLVSIEITTASFKTTRGYTLIGALLDEVAFWQSDEGSANPDKEIVAALRPAMSTIPGAMLLVASSPYAKRGILWDAHQRHFGKDGSPTLVWRASTREMNPTVRQSVIDEAVEADPSRAAAEYFAEFRSDIETFISRDVVEQAVVKGRLELAPASGIRYVAFVDPAGGSGTDSMVLAIAHYDERTACSVLDAVREVRPPFSPADVVAEFCALLKTYGITQVTGDAWGGLFTREPFHPIRYILSDKTKSTIYLESVALLNSKGAELLDQPRLVSQICALERRTARGGRDSVDHPPGQNDDAANAALGSLLLAKKEGGRRGCAVIGIETWGSRPLDGCGPSTRHEPDYAWLGKE